MPIKSKKSTQLKNFTIEKEELRWTLTVNIYSNSLVTYSKQHSQFCP